MNVRTVVHYGQEVKSKLFHAYDHGKENQNYYGQDTPPEYRIDVITAPVATYWSLNDWLADPAVSISLFGHHTIFFHNMVFTIIVLLEDIWKISS